MSRISELVACSRINSICECEDISFGKVFNSQAVAIAQITGVRLFGVEKTISDYAVRHIIKQHGNDIEERKRGQIGVTDIDFEKIQDIFLNYDEVIKGSIERGKQSIVFIKRIGALYHLAAILDEKRKKLIVRTMFKKP